MENRFLSDLDAFQKEAVLSGEGRLLVVAPPGSGKTRVLVSRFLYLIKNGARPWGLLALTFTNRAAFEMKERVIDVTGLDPFELNIGTFHSFCLKVLKRERPGFALFTRDAQRRLLRELGFKDTESVLRKISRAKNFLYAGSDEDASETSEEASTYQNELEKRNALDLDDIIVETIRIFESRPEVLEHYQKRFTHIMVDEYQDINPPQARLLRLLAGSSGQFIAIGDPDQSIYAFRGANMEGFLDFKDDYPGAVVHTLEVNYRSRGNIVEASRKLIENNSRRIENTVRPASEGGEIKAVELRDERHEAEFIIKEIEAMMGGLSSLTVGGGSGGGSGDFRFSDFAVLFRTNRQAESLIEAFKNSSLPYHLISPPGGGLSDFLEHLKGLDISTGAVLSEFINTEGKLSGVDSDLLDTLVHRASLYDGYDGLEGRAAMEAFIEETVLMDTPDNFDVKADRVALMTLHMAKGLEFPVVFIAGCEVGIIPLRIKNEVDDLEEERRLFYVGMTRAKENLYLLSARRRRLFGEPSEQRPSPFLDELPEELLNRARVEKKKTKRRAIQKGLFE